MLPLPRLTPPLVLAVGAALALAPAGCGAMAAGVLNTFYAFGGTSDGGVPLTPVTFDEFGNLYGAAFGGGDFCPAAPGGNGQYGGCGTLYKISAGGNFTTLVTFTGANGALPYSRLSLINNTLYGSTLVGGTNGMGVLFSVKTDGSAFKILHQFAGRDGASPFGSLVPLPGGIGLYGTTEYGGPDNDGVLFKILPDGSYLPLHAFRGPDGRMPDEILAGPADTLYGSTEGGGGGCSSKFGCGTVFSFSPDSDQFSTLYQFQGKSDGKQPYLGSVAASGVLYGATAYGGTALNGTLFAITPSGSGAYSFSTIHTFIGNEGIEPIAGPTLMSNGDLVGTTSFTLYRFNPAAARPFRVLNTFNDGANFAQPVVGPNGLLYGASGSGGAYPCVGTGGVVNSLGCGFLYTYTSAFESE